MNNIIEILKNCKNKLESIIHIFSNCIEDMFISEMENAILKQEVKRFFENYLDTWEVSDNDVEFNPITIGCCRCMKMEGLNNTINNMRILSGAKPRYKVRGFVGPDDDDEEEIE